MLLLAGLLQIAAIFTPAARVRIIGGLSFLRIPVAGTALAVLGALTIAVAFATVLRPQAWWRWLPGALSGAVLAVVYWRLARAPSATFIDPLLRRAVHPAWGIAAMAVAVLVSLIGALWTRAGSAPLEEITNDVV